MKDFRALSVADGDLDFVGRDEVPLRGWTYNVPVVDGDRAWGGISCFPFATDERTIDETS
jgi:hypothetical protein